MPDRTARTAGPFAERCEEDRHHFRFTVSPEDAARMSDLRAFTRELMVEAERDLGTKLDWVAVDHWNTDNPHVHVLVRGRGDDGKDLVISRDYISRGLRARAADRVTLELGPPQRARDQLQLLRRKSRPNDGLASIVHSVPLQTTEEGSSIYGPARGTRILSCAG